MSLKILVTALALTAVCLPALALAADTPTAKTSGAPATTRPHKATCFDAAWQSQEWKDCEAKMQARGQKR